MQNSWIYEPMTNRNEAFIFYNALQNYQDRYYYTPIAVARREEIGVKYRFLCIAIPKDTPHCPSHFADVEIYKPLKGMPYACSIYKAAFDQIFPHRFPLC